MDQPRSSRDLPCRDVLANAGEPASKAKRSAGAEPCISPRPEKKMKSDSKDLSASPVLRAAAAEKEVGEAGKPKEVPRIASAGETAKEGKRTAQEANSTCRGVLAAASAELASAVAKSAGDGPAPGRKSSSSDGAVAGAASRRPDKGTCQAQPVCEKSASSSSSAGAPRATRSSARQSTRDDDSKSPEKRRR